MAENIYKSATIGLSRKV